jgi:hypothetical protein
MEQFDFNNLEFLIQGQVIAENRELILKFINAHFNGGQFIVKLDVHNASDQHLLQRFQLGLEVPFTTLIQHPYDKFKSEYIIS